MRILMVSLVSLLVATAAAAADLPKPLVTGLKNPESVAVSGGKIYVSVIGEFGKAGDGAVLEIKGNKAVPFAKGLDDPKGLVAFQQWLYCADRDRIWRIDRKGKADVVVPAGAFPRKPLFLNDISLDEKGTLYVSDSGDLKGKDSAIYRITFSKSKKTKGKPKVTLVSDSTKSPAIKTANGLLNDSLHHLLVLDFSSGELLRMKIADGSTTKLAEGFGGGDGLAWDKFGRLFISDWKNGKVFAIPRPGVEPIVMAEGFKAAADICVGPANKTILVPDMKAGTLTALPINIPGYEVDDRPLALKPALAFPKLKWTGWSPISAAGKVAPLRPIVLTHAGDGTNRVFVATQRGIIHVFPNDQKAAKTQIFLNIQDRVTYRDNQNEEGFLGLAFHPDYKKNGEFFVLYTDRKAKLTNVLSRFKVSKDNPNRADPESEEELFRIKRPFWNHDGGTIVFGPDGYLYVALGDGGAANDPFGNGQNLKTLLGTILRIDVNGKSSGKKYAIPKDNPFVNRKDAQPEIWAYGLRNVWRMAFDRKTGDLWAADVGQNLWEEINLIERGGNYGWNKREALHPFGRNGVGPQKELIDPIWEYHHDIGKSITGGSVYRGSIHPELQGAYVYADYVTGKIWALSYDPKKKRVVANRPIPDQKKPVLTFGEDEKGEVYFMTHTPSGQGIYWFVPGS